MKTLLKTTWLFLSFAIFISCTEQQAVVEGESEAEIAQKAFEEKITATNNALFSAWNSGDASVMEAQLAENFTRKQNGETNATSAKEYIELMKFFRTAIPDMTFDYELLSIDGNKTYSKWTTTGVNSGMFGDQPPTGKNSVTHGFTILTYNEEGKAIAEEAYYDQWSYLEDWGYTLTPPVVEE